MSNKIIRSLIDTRLTAWAAAQVPPIVVAYENESFTPPQTKKYLRFFMLPAPTVSQFLEGTDKEYVGVFQISIVMPKGEGTGNAQTIANSLSTEFPNNLQLTSGSLKLQQLSPLSEANFIEEEDAVVLPVSAVYRAYVT